MTGNGFFEGCAKRGGVCDCNGRPCGMDIKDTEAIIQRANDVFTEEALKAQDGKTVPLRRDNNGPVIGEATMHYDSEGKALKANLRVDDPDVLAFLKGPPPSVIFKES